MFSERLPMEFIGGSKDGEESNAKAAPDYLEVPYNRALDEIYERQNDDPPFVYLQIGYALRESWK
jgi:hypothetical protein